MACERRKPSPPHAWRTAHGQDDPCRGDRERACRGVLRKARLSNGHGSYGCHLRGRDDIDRITSNIAEYLRCDLNRERSILFFDEVQLNGKALNSLRFFSESGWRVIATGSLLGVSVNVRARSLRKLVEGGRAPRAYRLSEQNFSGSVIEGTGCMLAGLPLYAAFTLGS